MGFLFAVSFFLFLKSLYLFVVQIDVVFKLFVILQKYDFSSKSQLIIMNKEYTHVVCDTAKVRFFKQITTPLFHTDRLLLLFVILQKYDFSSKSQLCVQVRLMLNSCLWYCKSTIFQANHNTCRKGICLPPVVCDTAKVRFFKQITTLNCSVNKL